MNQFNPVEPLNLGLKIKRAFNLFYGLGLDRMGIDHRRSHFTVPLPMRSCGENDNV